MQTPKLGRWSGDELQEAINANSGNRYNATLPRPTQFAHSVAKIIGLRKERGPATLISKPSVYLLGNAPETYPEAKRQPTISSGAIEIAGFVWFGPESMSSAKSIALPNGDADDIFRFVEEALNSGSAPAVYFDASEDPNVMRFYPEGLHRDDICEIITLSGASLTKETLKDLLDRVHERTLITPLASAASADLWADSRKWHPTKCAERTIQRILEIGLASALGAVRVRRENNGVAGRYDLGLVEQDAGDPAVWITHALLELKVVKSHTSTGGIVNDSSNRDVVSEGVTQANSYRREHGFRLSALCCFDMKKQHTLYRCFEHEIERANALNVQLWVWPLFSTTKAYREWLCATQLSS